jgi:hypothetical protein
MHIAFALFADAANISQEGKLNVLGVFDAVHVGGFPSVHPRATLVMRLKGDPGDSGKHVVAMSWTNADGEELWSSSGEVAVGPAPRAAGELDFPLIATIDLPLDGPGTYAMEILLDDEPSAEIRLHVRAGAPTLAPAPGTLLS